MTCLPTQHNFKTGFPISIVIGDPKLLDVEILRRHDSSNFSGLLLSSSASAFVPLVSPSLFHQLYSPVMSLTHQFRLQHYWAVLSTLYVASVTGTLLCTQPIEGDKLPWASHGPSQLECPWCLLVQDGGCYS